MLSKKSEILFFNSVAWFLFFRYGILHENLSYQATEGYTLGMYDYRMECKLILEEFSLNYPQDP